MRKSILSALMIMMLVLTGCGGTVQRKFDAAQKQFAQANQMHITAEIQADFGKSVENYTLDYQFQDETWTATVKAPEVLAGITARIAEDSSEIEYDGVILPTGDLRKQGVSPIYSVPLLVDTLKNGTTDSVWREGEHIVAKQVYDEEIAVTVWFSAEGTLVAGELSENGTVKVKCTFSQVELKNTAPETTEDVHNDAD